MERSAEASRRGHTGSIPAIASLVVGIGFLFGLMLVAFQPLEDSFFLYWLIVGTIIIFEAVAELGLEIRDSRLVRSHFVRNRVDRVSLSQNPVFAIVRFWWSDNIFVYTATTRQMLSGGEGLQSKLEVLRANCSCDALQEVSGSRVYSQRWPYHAQPAVIAAAFIGVSVSTLFTEQGIALFVSIPFFLVGFGLACYFALSHVNVKVVRIGSQLAVSDCLGRESQAFNINRDLELKSRGHWMTLVSGGKKIALPRSMMFMPSLMYDVVSIAQGAKLSDNVASVKSRYQ